MRVLLIGYGEIGSAVHEVFRRVHEIVVCDPARDFPEPEGDFDILAVAIPWSEEFVAEVKRYRRRHGKPDVVIFSTVPIGTTAQIHGAAHSPVEGKHPRLADSIRCAPRWIGGRSKAVERMCAEAGVKVRHAEAPEHTEFLKLRSTARYGVNIEFARYEASVAAQIGMDFDRLRQFDRDYNALYRHIGLPDMQRYVLTPPQGNIGGHCVVPNARLLDAQFPHPWLAEIYRDKEAEACSPSASSSALPC